IALLCPARSSTEHHIALDQMREQARPEVAAFLSCHEDEIALVESTSHALNLAAEAVPLTRGDRVLLSDMEFMAVGIPWCQKRDQIGIEIDVVPNSRGQVHVQDFADRLTPKTKVVIVSAVQWSSGFRVDLDGLSRLCRDCGVWFVVDAIQQLGAMPINVATTPIDILPCGGHKSLNAPLGTGFLSIRQKRLPELRPPLAGYLSVETPEGGWGNYFQPPEISPVRNYRYVDAARRFETGGTSNYPGAIGLAASLKMIRQLGQQTIAQHIACLTDHLAAGLQKLGVEVVTPLDSQHRAAILTFTLGSPEKNVAAMEYLLDRSVLVSVRYTSGIGGVRVSCHFFNNEADLDRLLEQLGGFLRGKT